MPTTASPGPVPELHRAHLLLGAGIYGPRKELVGRIEQLVLNRELDSVAYIVLGLDAKTRTALPLATIGRNNDGLLSTDVTAANIWRAPRFDSEKLTEMTSESFAFEVDKFYKDHSTRYLVDAGTTASAGERGRAHRHTLVSAGSPYLAATRLIGLGVRIDSGNLGSIRDLVFEERDGRVIYGVISFPGFAPVQMVVVPWKALIIRPQEGMARLDIDRSALETLAFSGASFPDLSDRAYTTRLFQTFGREPSWQVYGYAPQEPDPNAAWRADSDFNRKFDTARLEVVVGSVENVLTFVPGPGATNGLRWRVRTPEGDVVTVLAGPKAYCERIGLSLKDGDGVTIRGSEATVDGRSVILVSEVVINGALYRIRDMNGQPLWQPSE